MSERNPIRSASITGACSRRSGIKASIPLILVIFICFVSLLLSIVVSKLNYDGHHWGFQYSSAVDIINGLKPYSESLNQYGILTSLVHISGILLFGNSVVSVGIITGIFYSISFFVSYLLFRTILTKWLSLLSVTIMFLVHPYIVFPWPNYVAYTFLLIALLFMTWENSIALFFSGLVLSFSLLSRNSYAVSIAPTIGLYAWLRCYKSGNKFAKCFSRKKVAYFAIGMFLPLFLFFLYLLTSSSIATWFDQTFMISSNYWVSKIATETYEWAPRPFILFFYLAQNIMKGLIASDLRLGIYSIVFLNNLCVGFMILRDVVRTARRQEVDLRLALFSLTSTFGFLQALHVYDTFRLQPASALGMGVLIYSIHNYYQRVVVHNRKAQLALLGIGSVGLLAFVIVITPTIADTAVINPAQKLTRLMLGNYYREPKDIKILEGKLFQEDIAKHYENILEVLRTYECKLHTIVNLTPDSLIPYLSSKYSRKQVAPFDVILLSTPFKAAEKQRYGPSLVRGDALLFVGVIEMVPANYRIIRSTLGLHIAIPNWIEEGCHAARES
jgi:hypothetical protein